jgi:hypothetical protein
MALADVALYGEKGKYLAVKVNSEFLIFDLHDGPKAVTVDAGEIDSTDKNKVSEFGRKKDDAGNRGVARAFTDEEATKFLAKQTNVEATDLEATRLGSHELQGQSIAHILASARAALREANPPENAKSIAMATIKALHMAGLLPREIDGSIAVEDIKEAYDTGAPGDFLGKLDDILKVNKDASGKILPSSPAAVLHDNFTKGAGTYARNSLGSDSLRGVNVEGYTWVVVQDGAEEPFYAIKFQQGGREWIAKLRVSQDGSVAAPLSNHGIFEVREQSLLEENAKKELKITPINPRDLDLRPIGRTASAQTKINLESSYEEISKDLKNFTPRELLADLRAHGVAVEASDNGVTQPTIYERNGKKYVLFPKKYPDQVVLELKDTQNSLDFVETPVTDQAILDAIADGKNPKGSLKNYLAGVSTDKQVSALDQIDELRKAGQPLDGIYNSRNKLQLFINGELKDSLKEQTLEDYKDWVGFQSKERSSANAPTQSSSLQQPAATSPQKVEAVDPVAREGIGRLEQEQKRQGGVLNELVALVKGAFGGEKAKEAGDYGGALVKNFASIFTSGEGKAGLVGLGALGGFAMGGDLKTALMGAAVGVIAALVGNHVAKGAEKTAQDGKMATQVRKDREDLGALVPQTSLS